MEHPVHIRELADLPVTERMVERLGAEEHELLIVVTPEVSHAVMAMRWRKQSNQSAPAIVSSLMES